MATSPFLLHGGPIQEPIFPTHPVSFGLADLADAADRGAEAARSEARWLTNAPGATKILDRARLAPALWAALQVAEHIAVAVRIGESGPTVQPTSALSAGERGLFPSAHAGLVLRHAGRVSGSLNHLVATTSCATGRPCEALAVFGSQPARDFMPNIEASYVIPLGGDVIVHPNADAPLEVGAGEVHRVDGFPRIHSNQAGLTIVLVVKGFGPIDRKRALLARASRHPLIRVDVPVDIASSLAVYGVSEPQVYATLLQRAYEEVRNSATSDELTWTWLLGAALDPVPDPRPLPLRQVRGRFPGGVGVVELVNDRVAFVAGGQLMVCELADVERLVPFVAHEVVDVSQPELLLTADLLVRFGLAAPVEA